MAADINTLFPPPTPSASAELNKGEESSNDILQRVRAQTCYSALRGLITIFSVISGIVLVISAFACIVKGSYDQNELLLLLGIAGGILGLCIVVASQQASSLLIDIADMLIEQNRRKRRDDDTAG